MNPLMNESISLLKQNDLKVVYTVLHIKHRIKERKMYKKIILNNIQYIYNKHRSTDDANKILLYNVVLILQISIQ